MFLVYIVLGILALIFFIIGTIFLQKEKMCNCNCDVIDKKYTIKVDNLIEQLNNDNNLVDEQTGPIIIESTVLSETLEDNEEEIL